MRSLPLAIIRLGWIALAGLLTSAALAAAPPGTVLFSDTFAGQAGAAPANWMFGNSLSPGTPDAGDTFTVVNTGTSEVLHYIDKAPVVASGIPYFHTINPLDFTATGDLVLRLEADMTVNVNAADYRLGLYNSVGTNYATHCEAYQMRIYPNLAANNITLLTYSGSAVIDNVTSSAPQALLSGSHHYTFIVNYVLSKTAPVVQAYADGVLLAQITASPGGGFHPTGTDGAAVRIMAQCEFAGYPGTSGANVELDNVRLTAVPVSALSVPGLTQGPGATVLKDGSPYRGIGLNYFDCFYRTLLNSGATNTTYDAGFALLAQNHIPFVRFSATGFWANDMRLYQTNPAEYFRRMDNVVASAQAHGIGLIPSLFWFIATVPDLVGEHCNQWGNPDSATIAFMRQYVQDVVTRYQASPAIWAWEFGNECNSYADFPLALAPNYRPQVSVAGGSPAARTAEDDLTTAMLATAYNLFATEVRKYDYVRLITNGANYPRYTAYGFHTTYPANTSQTWLTNTPAQLQTIMGLLAPDPINLISVHCYNGTGDGWQNMTTANLAAAANAATALGKPLYVGEFQVDPSNTPAAIQPFRDFVAALDQYQVPLASTWVFDLAQQEADWSVSGTNARCWVLNELNTWHMLHDSSVPAAVKNLYDPQVVANSLVSQGDTARLQRVFAKAMSGGTITIAALGGSITQGAKATSLANGYAQQVANWWTTKFPKATIKLVNAGIGSTGSNYGSLRVKGDVLSQHPDLVLVDFAVNDVAGVESAQSYEGVLRQLLNDPGQPAVALLFMTRNDGICAQNQQAAIGSHYNLPMVSYHDAVWPLVLGSQIPWETVGADYIHPNDVGHAYAAYLITQMFEKAFVAGGPAGVAVTPSPLFSDLYEHTTLVDAAALVPVAGSNQGWAYDAVKQAWWSNTPGSTIQFRIPGQKVLLMNYHQLAAMGQVHARADNLAAITNDAYYAGTSGYRDICSLTPAGQVITPLGSGQHVITITLLATKNAASAGNEYRILGLGGVGMNNYYGWQAANFTAAQQLTPSTSGPTVAPANDGFSNLLKYALRLGPWTVGGAGLPQSGRTVIDGKTYVTLTYPQLTGATELGYTAEVSGDLTTWSSGAAATSNRMTPGADGNTQTVVARDLLPLGPATRRFIRLKVTGQLNACSLKR